MFSVCLCAADSSEQGVLPPCPAEKGLAELDQGVWNVSGGGGLPESNPRITLLRR